MLLALLCAITCHARAQDTAWKHWEASINLQPELSGGTDHKMNLHSTSLKPQMDVGARIAYAFNRNLELGVGLMYSHKGILSNIPHLGKDTTHFQGYTYLDIPLSFRLRLGVHNKIHPFLEAGYVYSMLLNAYGYATDVNGNKFIEGHNSYADLKNFGLFNMHSSELLFGVGAEYSANDRLNFRLEPVYQFQLGGHALYKDTSLSDPRLYGFGLQLSAGYRF